MDTTGQALLAAVLASPEDDQPRLIYADWLDEQEFCDRAEFIRVQCRIVSLDDELLSEEDCEHPTCPGCEERRALRRRERELLGDGRWLLWAHPVAPLVGRLDPGQDGDGLKDPLRANWALRRGFVESITCSSADWLSHADAILAAQPVREVRLTTWPRTPQLLDRMDDIAREVGWARMPAHEQVDEQGYALAVVLNLRWPRVTFTLPPHNVIPLGPGVSMPGPVPPTVRQIQELDRLVRLVRRAMRRT